MYQGKTKHVENVEYRFECDSSFMDEPSFNLAGTKMKSSLSPNDRNNKAIGIIEGIISRYNNTTNIDRLKGLEKVYITPTQNDAENKDQPIVNNQPIVKDHPIVTTWKLGDDKFFILRDFLIQFAFIAMFIGIFIQMLFQEKTITET